MTVRRSHTGTYAPPPDRIAAIIRDVLAKGRPSYKYTNVVESPAHQWTARIRPVWWPVLLSTRIHIQCVEANGGSSVTVNTVSQFYIMGDVFDFYRRYIHDLLTAIDEAAEAAS